VKRGWSLSTRLALLFGGLLLACGLAATALQIHAGEQREQEVVQRLSLGLAGHIAGHELLMLPDGPDAGNVQRLFTKLMDVNPSVELYLLGPDGKIIADAAPPGHLKRHQVNLAPLQHLLAGATLPVWGDDPRSEAGQKVFSAAPLWTNGRLAGYVYVVLIGEEHQALLHPWADAPAHIGAMALITGLALLAGLLALRAITRPLQRLTRIVQHFDHDGLAGLEAAQQALATEPPSKDEIGQLRQAFGHMAQRLAAQWQDLSHQDQQRRELVANISHDLRTPLTSLHGYLETLKLKATLLSEAERARYLDVAIGQSRQVGRLAQELFELARLEYGAVTLSREVFALPDLVQDVCQKFALAAEARGQRLQADIAPALPQVDADLGLIERVLTNLIDNAIRHTPPGGLIELRLRALGQAVEVRVRDDGPGVLEHLKPHLFVRPSFQTGLRGRAGGLGLVIVSRILLLHGSQIRLMPSSQGADFAFQLAPVRT